VGEIGPPAAKTDFFKNGLYFNEIRLRGSFWGVEHESEVRFLKFSPEVGEIGPPAAKTDFFKVACISMKFDSGVVFGV
jgi:hypothetical protein